MVNGDPQATATKRDLSDLERRLREELKLHMDVVGERIRDDINVFAETLRDRDHRIARLEQHPRLVPA